MQGGEVSSILKIMTIKVIGNINVRTRIHTFPHPFVPLFFSYLIKSCRKSALRRQKPGISLHLSLMHWSIATDLVSFTGISNPRICSSHSKTSPRRSSKCLTSAWRASSMKRSWRQRHAVRQDTWHRRFSPRSRTRTGAIFGAWLSSSSFCSPGRHRSTTRTTSHSLRRLSAANTTSTRLHGLLYQLRRKISSVSSWSPTQTSVSMGTKSWATPGSLASTRPRTLTRTSWARCGTGTQAVSVTCNHLSQILMMGLKTSSWTTRTMTWRITMTSERSSTRSDTKLGRWADRF